MRSDSDKCAWVASLVILFPGSEFTLDKLHLILDFEKIDKSANNIAQRIRRKNFYQRNGFHKTGNYTMLRTERFEVVCNKGKLRKAALLDLLCAIHRHRPEFLDILQ